MPVLILLTLSGLSGQSLSYPVGAGKIGMGHCSLNAKDIWGIFNNQAGAAGLQRVEAAIFFENSFLIPELNRIALGIFVPAGKGGFMLDMDHFGGGLYSEMKCGLGYTMRFGNHFSAGIQLDYLRLNIAEGHGNKHAFTFEGGIQLSITPKLSLGCHVFNPLRSRWSNSEDHIPILFRAGIGFKPEPAFLLCAEIQKSDGSPLRFCAGAEYRIKNIFFVRAGITSGAARYTFGAGFKIRKMRIDIASSVHTWLGYSPQLSFTYSFGK